MATPTRASSVAGTSGDQDDEDSDSEEEAPFFEAPTHLEDLETESCISEDGEDVDFS